MKKTLLMAAAALAAGVISSQAQPVYSQNIVGYANVASPVGSVNYLITVPFAMGASNGVNEVFGSSLPAFSSILIWNGVGYDAYVYDPTDPNGVGSGAPVWYLGDDATPASPLPTLPVGKGFFLAPAGPVTNVFVGTIAVSTGTSNNMVLPGSQNSLVASVVPYAGAVTNGTSSGGGPNLNNLPAFSSLLFWNGNGYDTAIFDPTDPNGVGAGAPLWYQGDDATPYVDPVSGGNVPTISVGEGFFLAPAAAYTWTTGL